MPHSPKRRGSHGHTSHSVSPSVMSSVRTLPRSGSMGDTDLHTNSLEEPINARGGADQGVHVGGVGNRTVDEVGQSNLAEDRHVGHGPLGHLGDAVVIGRKERRVKDVGFCRSPKPCALRGRSCRTIVGRSHDGDRT